MPPRLNSQSFTNTDQATIGKLLGKQCLPFT
jgi:hypothetical protein